MHRTIATIFTTQPNRHTRHEMMVLPIQSLHKLFQIQCMMENSKITFCGRIVFYVRRGGWIHIVLFLDSLGIFSPYMTMDG